MLNNSELCVFLKYFFTSLLVLPFTIQIKSGTVSALDVTFEATHSGKNKNNVVYVSESMEKDSKSWMFPFCKPLIKNHDMHEEPIGRVVDATFSQSDFAEDRDTINVTFRVSDEDAMKKLEEIANELEKNDLDLDSSVSKFEEGMKLSKQCSKMLEDAEKKITMLIDTDGEVKEKDFIPTEE